MMRENDAYSVQIARGLTSKPGFPRGFKIGTLCAFPSNQIGIPTPNREPQGCQCAGLSANKKDK